MVERLFVRKQVGRLCLWYTNWCIWSANTTVIEYEILILWLFDLLQVFIDEDVSHSFSFSLLIHSRELFPGVALSGWSASRHSTIRKSFLQNLSIRGRISRRGRGRGTRRGRRRGTRRITRRCHRWQAQRGTGWRRGLTPRPIQSTHHFWVCSHPKCTIWVLVSLFELFELWKWDGVRGVTDWLKYLAGKLPSSLDVPWANGTKPLVFWWATPRLLGEDRHVHSWSNFYYCESGRKF
jgi:hypothetical protein